MGHYRVHMGFRRRKLLVARDGAPVTRHHARPPSPRRRRGAAPRKKRRRRSKAADSPVMTVPDPDGPRIIWDTLLDSGATLPCLFEADLPLLRIHPERYAAQSGRIIATAESVTRMRVYELDVGVYAGGDTTTRTSTAKTQPPEEEAKAEDEEEASPNPTPTPDDDDPDNDPPILGRCTLPVVALPGAAASDFDDAAEQAPDRLSGLLPFHVCYVSGAPGNFRLWMGSGRRDVLGAGRLPGGMRYGGWKTARTATTSASAKAGRRADGGGREKVTTVVYVDDVDNVDDGGGDDGDDTHRSRRWLVEGLGGGGEELDLRTPKTVVFEHDFVDGTGAGGVLRDVERVGGGSVFLVSGPDGTDSVEGVHVLRMEQSDQPVQRVTKRRQSETRKPGRRASTPN
ncbi:hypothetical protein VTK56DRAFT_1807 [Thermocarpiscus australiensis]